MSIEVNLTSNSSLQEGDVVRIRLEDHEDVRISIVLALQQASHLNFLILLEEFDSLISINLPLEDRSTYTIQILVGEISDGTNLLRNILHGSPLTLHKDILLSLVGISGQCRTVSKSGILIERTSIAILIKIVLLEVLTRERLGQSIVLHQVVLSLNPSGLAAISGRTSTEAVVILSVRPLVGRSVSYRNARSFNRRYSSLRDTYGDVTVVEDVTSGLLNQRYANQRNTVDGGTALLSTVSLCLTGDLLRHLRTESDTVFGVDSSLCRLRSSVATDDELGEFELVLQAVLSKVLSTHLLVSTVNSGVVNLNELAQVESSIPVDSILTFTEDVILHTRSVINEVLSLVNGSKEVRVVHVNFLLVVLSNEVASTAVGVQQASHSD